MVSFRFIAMLLFAALAMAFIVGSLLAAAPTTSATNEPFFIANDEFKPVVPAGQFVAEVDGNVKRTVGSEPAGHIRSLAKSFHPNNQQPALRIIKDLFEGVAGKRIRLSAWVKTNDVKQWCGLEIVLHGKDQTLLEIKDMRDRPISGTMDWTKQQIVVDVPLETEEFLVGSFLYGNGEMWTDDFQIEIVGQDVALTDNNLWQRYSFFTPNYTIARDSDMVRDGHPAVCIASAGKAAPGQWIGYTRFQLKVDEYCGKRMRVSVWMKSKGVTGMSGDWVMVFGETGRIADEGERGHRPLKGTTDWKKYTVYVDVPAEAKNFAWGVMMNGTGKLWVDVDSAECVVDEKGL